MTKITLPIKTVRPDGEFFSQVTEAVMRGSKIEYEENIVVISLIDNRFFTIEDIKSILNSEGEVEYSPLKISISKTSYKNDVVPNSIALKLGYEPIVEDDEYKVEYKWNDIFRITEDIDEENIYMILSTNNEWIKASIAKEISDYLETELE
jgi:transcriptional/translational regulatory protein YebC/TACO1